MASSTGSLDHGGGGFTFTPPSFITSFTDLLSSAAGDVLGGDSPRGMFPRGGGNGGVPKFKSAQPPMWPSSYFAIPAGLSPAELLDSPVLLTSANNVLASPTTGAIPAQRFDWKQAADMIASQQQQESRAEFSFSSFNNNTNNNDTTAVVQQQQQQEQQQAAAEVKQSSVAPSNKLEDGYNWRKYGQKQVKGSENPRSYYKCTHHSCSMKKKVERSLADGRVTQIVYKGAHNHPKPLSTRRNSCSSAGGGAGEDHHHQQQQAGVNGNSTLSENSSVTFGDDDAENGGGPRLSDEPDAKRWKEDGDNEGISSGGPGKAVREPRLVVQTLSDIDILDDGFRWRKYGQKVVKGNPNPRSYYKCTTAGCPVRKHVERASHDPRAVITAYEGKHNHDVPVGRGAGAASRAPPAAPTTTHHSHPHTLEMMHTSSGYGYGAFQHQQQRAVTKDEPWDDFFVDSLLC